MDVLKVTNLTKTFKKFTAVDSISFSLKEGEILGLLGPNGAGKTTTIQMLLGVLTPTSGNVKFFNEDFATHREQILEKINFSSTYTNLPWDLSVKETLTYTTYLYDIPDRKKTLDELIDQFRLTELLKIRISELSAGQLTRVNLAKSFLNDPKILLLDEPTASLDPEVARFVRNFILKKQKEHTLSIIFTSHNMSEVEEVCDRILFINNGKIVADDTPQKLMKSMETCKVRLVIDIKNGQKLIDYAQKTSKKVVSDEQEFTVELKETEIVDLLQFLNTQKIKFYEISIDKPDLEDYFLKVAKDNTHKDF